MVVLVKHGRHVEIVEIGERLVGTSLTASLCRSNHLMADNIRTLR
jgi:hypothetical protein